MNTSFQTIFFPKMEHPRDDELQPPRKRPRISSPSLGGLEQQANLDIFLPTFSEPTVGRDEIRSSGLLFSSLNMKNSLTEDLAQFTTTPENLRLSGVVSDPYFSFLSNSTTLTSGPTSNPLVESGTSPEELAPNSKTLPFGSDNLRCAGRHIAEPETSTHKTVPSSFKGVLQSVSISAKSPNPFYFPEYTLNVGVGAEQDFQFLNERYHGAIKPEIEELRIRLKTLQTCPLDLKEVKKIESLQVSLQQNLEDSNDRIESLSSLSILAPNILHQLHSLRKDLFLEGKQLELYENELQFCVRPDRHQPTFATLVVAKQPFPKPIKKNIKVCGADGDHEEPTLVRLLHFSRANVRPTTPVKADVIVENYHEKDGVFTSDTVQMSPQGDANFDSLKFQKATRKKVARLQFSVQAEIQTDRGLIRGPIQGGESAPFIVFTNECQWEESEGILLVKDCFGSTEVPFEKFANCLQSHFLRSTRQNPSRPQRGLSLHDLNYFSRNRFKSRKVVTNEDCSSFFPWFGKILRKIRHQQHFQSLFLKGLLYGFIGRSETENLLSQFESGTFLIRFSESVFGKLVISSVHEKGGAQVFEHLLVSAAQHDSVRLVEVLQRRKGYKFCIVVNTEFCPEPEQTFSLRRKEDAFGEYFVKHHEMESYTNHYLLDDGQS